MKKVISIVVILLLAIGCSSNSEEQIEEEAIEPIIGIWKLTSISVLGQEFINDCKSKDKIEIRTDKTFTITGHNEDDNCAPQSSSGSWVSDTGNMYKLTAAGDIQTLTLTLDNLLTFSFQQDSNTIVYSFKKE